MAMFRSFIILNGLDSLNDVSDIPVSLLFSNRFANADYRHWWCGAFVERILAFGHRFDCTGGSRIEFGTTQRASGVMCRCYLTLCCLK